MKKLHVVLGLQLLFFAAWAGYLLTSRNADTPEFYLETTPVDPRDLISGTYVALDYAIARPRDGNCPGLLGNALSISVRLEDRGRTADTAQGPVAVYEAADCAREARAGWARAKVDRGQGGRPAARYGIERFFLNENDPRKDARSGSVLAKVKLDRTGQLVLLDLVSKTEAQAAASPAPSEAARAEAGPETPAAPKAGPKEELPAENREVIKEETKFESLILKSSD